MFTLRHQGSPQARDGLTLAQIVEGLQDGLWEPTDEIRAPGEREWRTLEDHPATAEIVAEMEAPPPVRYDEGTHLDMNAIIDVCLVLLIFFVLTASYAAAVQKVIPLSRVEKDNNNDGVVVIRPPIVENYMIRLAAVQDKTGDVRVFLEKKDLKVWNKADKSLDQAKLKEAIAEEVRRTGGNKREMLFEAQNISWGTAVTIQDTAKAAGVNRIHYLVEK
jgi:biopolymer transport protein ExbD